MKQLYAPWRGTYSDAAQKQTHQSNGCPFCNQITCTKDEEHFIIKRFEHHVVMLNLYPYNPGHLLIVPTQHVARLDKLNAPARAELMEIINQSVIALEKACNNSGTNIGVNLGDHASGGSIPEHLHCHVLPRWKGDTNFLPLLAQTKQLSEDLTVVYKKLKQKFEQ